MGALNSQPVTEKETEEGNLLNLRYGMGAMQGWRRQMEDAHAAVNFQVADRNVVLVGVFDGHGGKGVAQYCAQHLRAAFELTLAPLAEASPKAEFAVQVAAALPGTFHRLDTDMNAEEGRKLIRYLECGNEKPEVAFMKQFAQMRNGPFAVGDDDDDDDDDEEEQGEEAGEGDAPPAKRRRIVSAGDDELEDAPPEGGDQDAAFDDEDDDAEETLRAELLPKPSEAESAQSASTTEPVDEDSKPAGESTAPEEPVAEKAEEKPAEKAEVKAEEKAAPAAAASGPKHGWDVEDDEDESEEDPREAKLRSVLHQHGSPEGMGATATVCALIPPKGDTKDAASCVGWTVVCANAGDSRSVLCRGGKAMALSEDHKPDDATEKSRIYAAGGTVENGRVCQNLNLSRALGDFNYKDFSKPPAEHIISGVPDLQTVTLTAEDEFLILACDGCWETYDRQAVVDYIRPQLQKAGEGEASKVIVRTVCEFLDKAMCQDLRSPGFDGSGCDNMTMLVVQLKTLPSPETAKA